MASGYPPSKQAKTDGKQLTVETMNQLARKAEYAVRGRLPLRAAEIQKDLAKGVAFPFEELVYCNIGNPQAVGQKPLTFNREVLSLLTAPHVLSRADELVKLGIYGAEAVERAREYHGKRALVGAYTDSAGYAFIREEVCDFTLARDGYRPSADHVFLTNGASEGVRLLMSMLAASHLGGPVGIMAPIPQYPLYSALTTLIDGELCGYYLDEEGGWAITTEALEKAYKEAVDRGVKVRALVVINPGNPSGANLDAKTLENIVRFASEKGIILLADEVYQENILSPYPFKSARKVVCELGLDLEVASFHSLSKGFLGECGIRGGYVLVENFDAALLQEFVKVKSIELCSNTIGQLSVGLMVRPPTKDGAALYAKEKTELLESLKARAEIITKALSSMEGITMPTIGGAMYAFPQIRLPPGAIKAAAEAGLPPDEFYCMQVLEKTGLRARALSWTFPECNKPFKLQRTYFCTARRGSFPYYYDISGPALARALAIVSVVLFHECDKSH